MLSAILARNLIRLGQYAEGRELLDRVLSSAERVGAANIAAEAMVAKGLAYGFQGRMWEARALYGGARQLAEEINRPDLMASATQNLSFEVALDDPRLAVDLQRGASTSHGAWVGAPSRSRPSETCRRTRGGPATGSGCSRRSTPP